MVGILPFATGHFIRPSITQAVPPPPSVNAADYRTSVYGKSIQISQGVRGVTGYPIWSGPYIIPGGVVLNPIQLANVGFVPSQTIVDQWPDVTQDFAVAFGRQLAPESERHMLTVRRMYANGIKFYSAEPKQAAGTLTGTANFANTETVTINAKVYTFQTTLTNTDGHVKVAASLALSLVNLANAINRSGAGVAGTDFAAATTAHPTVVGTYDATHLFVTARAAGLAGNSITTTEACGNASFGAGVLSGGTDADVVEQTGDHTFTLYQGTSTQTADPIIAADRGDLTPAFRDTVYIVFNDFMPGLILGSEPYQIPTITVEFKELQFSLSDVLRHLAIAAGYDPEDISVDSTLTSLVAGVVISERFDSDQLFDDLGLVYGFRHFESEDQIKFVRDDAAAAPAYSLTRDDLVQLGSGYALETAVDAPSSAPYSVQFSFLNNFLYTWESAQFTGDGQILQLDAAADKQLKIPFVMSVDEATARAARAWYKLDAMTVTQNFQLTPRHLLLEPSDVVELSVGVFSYRVQISTMSINGDMSISCSAANFDFDNQFQTSLVADFPYFSGGTAPPPPDPVTPGSSTFDGAASGTYTVPPYNVLTIEIWGPGGPGLGVNTGGSATPVSGTASTPTTVATLGMTANNGGVTLTTPGTASGGNTANTTGSNGSAGAGTWSGAPDGTTKNAGAGGAAPNGGGATAPATAVKSGSTNGNNGAAGNAPGGGGGGAARNHAFDASNIAGLAANGGPSGGYSKSVYVFGVTAGYPAWGASLAYNAGAASTGGAGSGNSGGSGAAGRVKFTVA